MNPSNCCNATTPRGKSTKSAVILIALSFAASCTAATVNGTISGKVVDDTGKPVSGARVFVSYALPANAKRPIAPPVVTGQLAQSVTANNGGVFEVDNLRAGNYVVCAQTLTPGLLDPCHWATSAPEVTVVADQKTNGVQVTMARGAVIPIHVDDPQGLLKPVSGPIDSDCQFHAVTAKGLHYYATIQASNATGRDHAITVPFGAPVTIQVISPHLKLNDSSGNVVAAKGATVNAQAGAAVGTFVYSVSGKN